MGRTLSIFDLPIFVYDWNSYNVNSLISYELDYDEVAEQTSRDNTYDQLNDNQKYCFDIIVAAIDESLLTAYFFL